MLKEFGQDLRKLRELKGISIAEISAESRINPKFLTNIENGIFDFQPEAYIRSFLKAYAKSLDESEIHMLNDYDKAKAGFYARRKFTSDEGKEVILPEEKISISVTEQPKQTTEQLTDNEPVSKEAVTKDAVYSKSIKQDKPDYFKPKEEEPDPEFSNRSLTQKVLLGVLIIAVLAGIYFLVDYLNSSGQQKSDVKPKSFNEISSEYENKISGKNDSVKKNETTQTIVSDSLKLMIKALKDITIKVYIDENKQIDENISGKDSMLIMAKDQFRFSANANASVELYLNGKYLRKPASLSSGSIKNLIIKKDGIVTQ
jgi:cytoskeletal protein RodZ